MLLSLIAPLALAAPAKVPAGTVEISTAVEVPLYAGLRDTDYYAYVEVKAGETPLLRRVSTSSSRVILTDAAAKALGLKPNKKTKQAKLKSFTLGGATFENVTVYAGPLSDGVPAHASVDGELGIGAFPELSWAILRSSGKLRVGPASAGSGWVSELGGGTPFTSKKSEKFKVGKESGETEDAPTVVELAWDGVKIPTEIVSAGPSIIWKEADTADRWWSIKGKELPVYALPKAPAVQVGEFQDESRKVAVGGAEELAVVTRAGKGPAYIAVVPAQLGIDVLSHYDLAIDAGQKSIALKPAKGSALASYAATYEADLRKALEPAPAKDGAAPDPEAVKSARAGAIAPLASWLNATGKVEEALALTKERTELEPDSCTAWQAYGMQALEAGKAGDAVPALKKAAELYEPWGSKPLEARNDLQKEYDAAKKSKGAYSGVIPQPHICFTAWGNLAHAYVVNGQPEKVAELYPSKLDLDEGLANAAGMAALVKGDAAAAEAAFRQAIHLDPKNSEAARTGLFLAISDRARANAQLERGNVVASDPAALSIYAEAIRKLDGGSKAIEAVKALHDQQPFSPMISLELARQLQKDGNTGAAEPLLKQVRSQLEGLGAASAGPATVRAAWVLLLVAEGQADAAKTASDALMAAQPGEAVAYWSGAVVAETAGDTNRATELRRKAAIVASSNPLYVVAAAR
jgi:tetratricopeptide (TPR) repeat protein